VNLVPTSKEEQREMIPQLSAIAIGGLSSKMMTCGKCFVSGSPCC